MLYDVAKWGKLLEYLMWELFDVPNGLEKLKNLSYYFRNDFSNKNEYKTFTKSIYLMNRYLSCFIGCADTIK